MNHCVPDFEMDDDYSLPTSSSLFWTSKSSVPEDEVMELLWQNGQVVMRSQNQRSMRKSPASKFDATIPAEQSTAREFLPSQQEEHQLFMQEDEMASWLHYPLVDDPPLDHNFCSDLLYATSPQCVNQNTNTTTRVRSSHVVEHRSPLTITTETATDTTTVTTKPPIPPMRRMEPENKIKNFLHFSRHKPRAESGTSNSKSVVKESTVVDSSETPSAAPESRASEMLRTSVVDASESDFVCGIMSGGGVAGTSSGGAAGNGGKEGLTCEMTVTSSPGCSSASASASVDPAAQNRKRKGKEADDTDCQSEDVEFESADAKKPLRGSTSTKRSRAAEVHNLSERRRRDRINEKMKALQELIPRCNKSDKASMLDEAIEYLKSLQLQVQMMSMGCGMVPMVFPGLQQFMPPMGMGIGMGMGMEMGLNRPMMPYPNMLAGSALPRPPTATHLGPSFPMPAFHMPPIPNTDPSRIQAVNQSDHMLNSHGTQSMSQPRVSSFVDAYQQFLNPHQQMQLPLPPVTAQNQPVVHPSTTSNTCTTSGPQNLENRQSG